MIGDLKYFFTFLVDILFLYFFSLQTVDKNLLLVLKLVLKEEVKKEILIHKCSFHFLTLFIFLALIFTFTNVLYLKTKFISSFSSFYQTS